MRQISTMCRRNYYRRSYGHNVQKVTITILARPASYDRSLECRFMEELGTPLTTLHENTRSSFGAPPPTLREVPTLGLHWPF